MKKILHKWHFMRIARVVLATAILVQSWYAKDNTTAVFGVLLLSMGVFDIGCCGAGSCYTPLKKNHTGAHKKSVYEEVV